MKAGVEVVVVVVVVSLADIMAFGDVAAVISYFVDFAVVAAVAAFDVAVEFRGSKRCLGN